MRYSVIENRKTHSILTDNNVFPYSRASSGRKSVESHNEIRSSQQKRQLHELDHYMENSTASTGVRGHKQGQGQGQGQGGSKKRPLTETRPSAERVCNDEYVKSLLMSLCTTATPNIHTSVDHRTSVHHKYVTSSSCAM